jgi:transposase
MPIIGGLDIHRKQLTFDCLDTVAGESVRGQQVSPADREHLRA